MGLNADSSSVACGPSRGPGLVCSGTTFDCVGGHTSRLFVGCPTVDGRPTILKRTTFLEVHLYLSVLLACNGRQQRTLLASALRELRPFIPALLAVYLPSMETMPDRAPCLSVVGAAIHESGVPDGDTHACGRWLDVEQPVDRCYIQSYYNNRSNGLLCLQDNVMSYFMSALWGIRLRNEEEGLQEPCVMDVKIGSLRYSRFTTHVKVSRIQSKERNTLVPRVAMRICGMRRYVHADGARSYKEVTGKGVGYALGSPKELQRMVDVFFTTAGPRTEVLHLSPEEDALVRCRKATCAKVIKQMLNFFKATEEGRYLLQEMAFVSTSVLLLYDAVGNGTEARVRLIDFGQTGPRCMHFGEEEVGFLKGLENLLQFLDPL